MNTPTTQMSPQTGLFRETSAETGQETLIWAAPKPASDVSGRIEARLGVFQAEGVSSLARLQSFETLVHCII